MGMYDSLGCRYPLPNPEFQDSLFQTKDLDCELKIYEITADGRLIKNEYDTEVTPKRERPYPDAADDDWRSLAGIMRSVKGSERKVEIPFNGDLFFYTSQPHWVEYRAHFEKGRLLSIECVRNDKSQECAS